MTHKSDIEVKTQTSSHSRMAGLEALRQQQRKQTLEWVSLNALSTLRNTWREAKLVNSGVDGAPDPDTLVEITTSRRS